MPTITITEKQQAIAAARATDDWNHVGGEWDSVVVFFTNPGTISFHVRAEFNDDDGTFREAVAVKIVITAHDGSVQPTVKATHRTNDWFTFIGWIKNDPTVEEEA